MRVHLFRSERTVETDRQQFFRMKHGDKKRLGALSRQHTSAGVAERRRKHDGNPRVPRAHGVGDRVHGGFGIQRIENGFHEQQIGAAVDQSLRLHLIGLRKFVERDIAGSGIIDGRRH